MEADLVFRKVTVVDGTGSPSFVGDVAICGEKIGHVGCFEGRARRIIQGEGLVLAPGFIDVHGHSDDTLLVDPRGESKVQQGVTTEVIGNCGFSLAPLEGEAVGAVEEELSALGVRVTWRTMQEYLERLQHGGLGLNVVPLVGHNTVRKSVLGFADRTPKAGELAEMCRLVAEAMAQGAFGLSSGLIYPPGCFAPSWELEALARVMAAYRGIYTTHLRDEGDALEEAVTEALTLGRNTGIAVHLSHHKASGPANWGKVRRTGAMMAAAREQGQDVTCDVYPYTATSTSLASLLPAWVHAGGEPASRERLADHATRERIQAEVTRQVEVKGGWRAIFLTGNTPHLGSNWAGRNLEEVAAERGLPPAEVLCRLLEEDWHLGVVRFLMSEDDVAEVLRLPWCMVGSDASSRSPQGVLGQGVPHPRAYGTFPRLLGVYVREKGVLTWEEVVYRVTGLAAWRFGLRDRGLIRPGMAADLVLFDPHTIRDTATYQEPHQFPFGIKCVLVNGRIVVEERVTTGILPGKVLIRYQQEGNSFS